jgi:hypothetical protein
MISGVKINVLLLNQFSIDDDLVKVLKEEGN